MCTVKSNRLILVVAGVFLLCLCITVATATLVTPFSVIEQGAPVFIGEGGLNITHALNAAYGNSDPDGDPTPATGPATIGWWAFGNPGDPSFTPDISINLSGRYTNFLISQAEFEGHTGTWRAVVPLLAGSDQVKGVVFIVQDPSLDIKIYDNSNKDVTDTSVPRGTRLKFHVETNMYPSRDYAYRGPSDSPILWGNIAIKVIDPNGEVYNSLLNDSIGTPNYGPNSIDMNLVDTSPWNWGDLLGFSWYTGALNKSVQPSYPAGTYIVTAESTLHGMIDNYKDSGGNNCVGKTVSAEKTVTILEFRAAAVTYGINHYLGGNPQGSGKQELLVTDNVVPADTFVTLLDGSSIKSPDSPSYLVFVDEDKNGNWGHPCKMVFYADGKDLVDITSDMPPVGIEMAHVAGKFKNLDGLTSITGEYSPDPACNPVTTNNYALLISGGGTKETNYARYYNDTKFMYNTLVNDYKYDKNKIKVLMSDGPSDSNADKLTTTRITIPFISTRIRILMVPEIESGVLQQMQT
jgi:hypothetical protein